MLFPDILSENQKTLLPLVNQFNRSFYLVGGTAIALQIGHRRSIDFDLFTFTRLNHKNIHQKILTQNLGAKVTRRVEEQFNLIILDVKFTFFQFPFEIPAPVKHPGYPKMPTLLDLACMKAYALGRRAKWKDYVDLYFILKKYLNISQISQRAHEIFGDLYSEKQFRAQLCYFNDVDYREEVDYLVSDPGMETIQSELTQFAIDF
jgi:hypothetical protein